MILCGTVLPTWASHQATVSSTKATTAQTVDMIRNVDIASNVTPAYAAEKIV